MRKSTVILFALNSILVQVDKTFYELNFMTNLLNEAVKALTNKKLTDKTTETFF